MNMIHIRVVQEHEVQCNISSTKKITSKTGFRSLILLLLTSIIVVNSYAQNMPNSSEQMKELNQVFSKIETNNTYVENLNFNEESAIFLPVGLKRTIGGMDVTIAVSHFSLHQASSELGIFAKVIIPQGSNGKRIVMFFGAEGISGTFTGGLSGEIKLSLLHDIEIPFNRGNTKIVLKGNGLDKKTGMSQSNTYITVGCDGFHNLALDAEVHFPTSLIVKANSQNYTDTTNIDSKNQKDSLFQSNNSSKQVIGHFSTIVNSWDDLIVSLNLPNFEIKGLKDYVFSLDNVVLDFSSQRNSDITRFPYEYEQSYLTEERVLWRGVYAENVSITLPKAFSNAKFSAKGLLIDENGISGLFSADNILSIENGNADGWNFSVDHFGIKLIANELVEAKFKGLLGLPFKGKRTTLGYEGLLYPDNEYIMRVNNADSIDFSIFNAQAVLEQNSKVTLHLKEDHFIPEAVLNGYISLGGVGDGSSESKAKFQKIKFRNLKLTSEAPYISAEYFGYEGKANLGNFPLSINKIALSSSSNGSARLVLGAGIDLGKKLFSGETEIGLVANYKNNKWSFSKLEVGTISLNAVIAGVVGLDGRIDWYRDDAIYGNGFAGSLNLGVNFSGKVVESTENAKYDISIHARAGFGRKDDNSYWYATGMAEFTPGIAIVGPLTLNGIGGALTYGVKGTVSGNSQNLISSTTYLPDPSMGLSLKASVLLEVSEILRGEAAFEMVFSRAGGLSLAGFYGLVQIPNDKNKKENPQTDEKLNDITRKFPSKLSDQFKQNDFTQLSKSIKSIPNAFENMGINGTLCAQMDFNNNVFHATTNVFVSTPGNIICGIGDGGEAGWGVLHIDPKEWYMHMGTPSNRIGLQLNVGNILAVRSGSYFMAGYHIPEMPAPPKEVADILGTNIEKLKIGRNLNTLSTGKGLAFGSELAIKTGDIQFLLMYANFNAGLGFDIMFKDYGEAQCKRRSGKIGLNGWYATGQTYAYLSGELGVKVKLWLLRTRIPIIKGGTAMLLQAGLPDPTFFKGNLGVDINVLGLIKGKANFKLSIGEECDVVVPGSSPLDEPVINDLSPSSAEQEVSVFAMPQATFNVTLGKSFEAVNDLGEKVCYRINLKEFVIKDKEENIIPRKLTWGKDRRDVCFELKEILPPNTNLTAKVSVEFEELKNGKWQPVFTAGKPAVEEKIHNFTTGNAPNDIPMQNVVYAYPIVNQRYMLTEETSKGYVQLRLGQKYLFERGYDYKLYFISKNGNIITTDYKYNDIDNRIEFSFPKLDKQTSYKFDLCYKPIISENMADKEKMPNDSTAKFINNEDFSGTIGGNKAESLTSSNVLKSILCYEFSTSCYATFKDKINDLKIRDALAFDAGVAIALGAEVHAKEVFDEAEIKGVEKTQNQPLITCKASLQEEFFVNTVLPLVYDGYPYGNIRLNKRNEQPLGVPPYNAISINQYFLNSLDNNTLNASRFRFPYVFDVSPVSFKDFRDLQTSVINSRSTVTPQVYNRFASGSLPFLKKGKYKIIMNYKLPDGTTTSSAEFYYKNEINLNK